MDIKKLKEELIVDEGLVGEIYKCSAGYPTFGVGEKIKKFGINHLVGVNDPEYNMPAGTPVSFERIQQAFDVDIQDCIEDAEFHFPKLYTYPEEIQRVIANMEFNIGRRRFGKFKKMIAAIEDRNWEEMAKQMKNSLWYHQVGNRSKRLIERVLSVRDTHYKNLNQLG